jgi:hypothetical protein
LDAVAQTAPSVEIPDGTHVLRWSAESVAGKTATGTVTVCVDATPPVIHVSGNLGALPFPATRVEATDGSGVSAVRASLVAADGTAWPLAMHRASGDAWEAAVPPVGEGSYTLRASAVDGHGLASGTIDVARFLLLQHVPSPVVTVPASAAVGASDDIILRWAFPSPWPVGLSASIQVDDDAPVTLGDEATIHTEGAHWVRIVPRDGIGNVGEPILVRVLVDRSAPTLADGLGRLAYLPGESFTRSFTLDAGVSAQSLRIAVDGHDQGPGPARIVGAGVHTLSVTTSDAAGNLGGPFNTTVVLDAQGPIVEVGDLLVATPEGEVRYVATDDLSPISSVEARIVRADGVDQILTAADGIARFTALTSGHHRIEVRATDAAGNVGAWSPANLTVDLDGPALRLSGAPSIANAPFDVTLTAGDDTPLASATLEIRTLVGTTTLRDDAAPFEFRVPVEKGAVTLVASGTDASGRSSTIGPFRVDVDLDPPTIEIFGVEPGATVTKAVHLDASAIDRRSTATLDVRECIADALPPPAPVASAPASHPAEAAASTTADGIFLTAPGLVGIRYTGADGVVRERTDGLVPTDAARAGAAEVTVLWADGSTTRQSIALPAPLESASVAPDAPAEHASAGDAVGAQEGSFWSHLSIPLMVLAAVVVLAFVAMLVFAGRT